MQSNLKKSETISELRSIVAVDLEILWLEESLRVCNYGIECVSWSTAVRVAVGNFESSGVDGTRCDDNGPVLGRRSEGEGGNCS